MKIPTLGQSFRFAVFPGLRRYLVPVILQWWSFLLILEGIYKRCGLIAEKTFYFEDGLFALLKNAWTGWKKKWWPSLKNGWRAGVGEGLTGRVGGLWHALTCSGRHLPRDTAAVMMPWIVVIGIWTAILWSALNGVVFTAAYAATAGTSGAPAAGDLAQQILGDMFSFISGGAPTSLAQGLGAISQAISLAVTSFGALIAIWTGLIIMPARYVDNPEIFKQHYSWPFFFGRLALAMVLLAPLAASGYGLGQQIVGQLGLLGSNKTSDAWVTMVGTMNSTALCQAAANTGSGTANCAMFGTPLISQTDLHSSVMEVVMAEACRAAINNDPNRSVKKAGYEWVEYESATLGNEKHYNYYINGQLTGVGGCGRVTFPTSSTDGTQAVTDVAAAGIVKAEQTAFDTLRKSIGSVMDTLVQGGVACMDLAASAASAASSQTSQPPPASTGSCPPPLDPSKLADWIGQYNTDIQAGVTQGIGQANAGITQQLSASATQQGWIGAVAWGLKLTNLQSSFQSATDSIPRISPPTAPDVEGTVASARTLFLGAFNRSGTPMAQTVAAQAAGSSRGADDTGFLAVVGNVTNPAVRSWFPTINAMSPFAGLSFLGRWTYSAALGMKTLEQIGSKMDGAAAAVMGNIGGRIAGEAGANIGKTVGGWVGGPLSWVAKMAAGTLSPVINILWAPLFIIGLALAYLVPSLPYLRFLFAVMGWLIAFVSAVLLTPVLLVLMINGEHGGVFGPAVKPLLLTVGGLVLRPALTLAGFLAGLMICTEMIAVLNMTFAWMVTSTGPVFIGFVGFLAVYLGLAYSIVNAGTKFVEILPNEVYKWLGAQAGASERDDASTTSQALTGAVNRFVMPMGKAGGSGGK